MTDIQRYFKEDNGLKRSTRINFEKVLGKRASTLDEFLEGLHGVFEEGPGEFDTFDT